MGKGINISVLGDKELDAQLGRMDLRMQTKIVGAAIDQALQPILASAKAKAPVKTGRMRDSIKIAKTKKRKGGVIAGRVVTGTRAKLRIKPEDPYYYPMAVETGHRGAAAKPFLRPALAEGEAQALSTIKAVIASGLEASK